MATRATCPSCGHVVTLRLLVVKDGVWRFPPAYAEPVAPVVVRDAEGRETEAGRRLREREMYVEIARTETALRERFGDDHELLRPGVFRGTLWLQAAAWALDDGDRD